TTGLHLCVRCAGIQPGDLVLTTPFSFVSSSNVILFEQAIPVFVDVDPLTGNIDPVLVEQSIKDIVSGDPKKVSRWLSRKGAENPGKLKAIIPVDVFGQPVDYDPIQRIAEEHDLVIIEDSCEAIGAEYKGRKAGTLGAFGVFAFYPNKQITTGEGGMVVTNDDQAAEMIRALRNQGRAPGDTWLQHTYLGYNYRLNEMSAALGLSQMKRIDELIERRQKVADRYNQQLVKIDSVEIPYVSPTTTRMSWFVYVIRLKENINRDRTAAKLEQARIPVRPYFLPIHLQPYMVERFGYKEGDFPITEDLGQRGLALPFSSSMTEAQVDIVCEKVADCLTS
ncbi:MAG: DegT/DnrJ/EryC1/StrS family aminotransferase, partial [Chloroflexi bacterium]|nr:DegT/DnrJ/EryC1/StrS family aminotransferase [Chloroflexota bacterium]